MFCIIKFIFFILTIFGFGFVSLSQLTKIKSLILLAPLSVSFGISAYVFLCHCLSFLIGPSKASIVSIFILFFISVVVLLFKHRELFKFEVEIKKNQFISLFSIAFLICILSFLAIYRFGTFDKEFHIPLALTMYHNNVYPPKDFFRPDYVLLYHYGGDLLAGALCNFCKINVSRAYELIASIFSGTIFLSYFALAWLITRNFKLSFIAGFCSYFGSGLLWLDAILRYFSKNLPEGGSNWGFLQTFFNLGIHGGIYNPPSVCTFISTFNIGFPTLILCLILFWKMIEESNSKTKLFYLSFLNVSLFTLFFSSEWLFATFWAGVLPFALFMLLRRQKQFILPTLATLIISVILVKSIGNALFLQDVAQGIGRVQIFDIALKEKLFSVMSWGRLTTNIMNYQQIPFFSWEFVSEFGLSLFLFPIILFYLVKVKSELGLLFFLISAFTMPAPLIIDFKINPVDLNRMFAFGNTMLILLITCSLGTLFKIFTTNKLLFPIYMIAFCLSPLSGLVGAVIFTPYISFSKPFVQVVFNELNNVKSQDDLKKFFRELNSTLANLKAGKAPLFKEEISFLKKNSKPKDVAISNILEVPLYAGVYTLIPAGKFLYKDLLYSSYDSIYPTVITTLDPHLLNELNIKWIILNKNSKDTLPKEAQEILNNIELFKLVYSRQNPTSNEDMYEIYHVENVKELLSNFSRKTAWILLGKQGQPIEISDLKINKITLFPTSRNALLHLKDLYKTNPILKKELITAQAITIDSVEKQIKDRNLNIEIDKKSLLY